jgi:hypothetical protein
MALRRCLNFPQPLGHWSADIRSMISAEHPHRHLIRPPTIRASPYDAEPQLLHGTRPIRLLRFGSSYPDIFDTYQCYTDHRQTDHHKYRYEIYEVRDCRGHEKHDHRQHPQQCQYIKGTQYDHVPYEFDNVIRQHRIAINFHPLYSL